jgi:hypothetical protein
MKHKILIGLAVALGCMFVFGVLKFSVGTSGSDDLVVANDTTDTISCEYKKDGKDVVVVVKPGGTVTGGKGFMRFFTAKKDGSYEIMYPFPRPSLSSSSVGLTKIIQAAKQSKVDNEVYTEKGMIGDIKVMYESILQSGETY